MKIRFGNKNIILSNKNVYNFENVYSFEIFQNFIIREIFKNYAYVPRGYVQQYIYNIIRENKRCANLTTPMACVDGGCAMDTSFSFYDTIPRGVCEILLAL